MQYGTVIQFFPDKGFGFIKPERGPDIFFHVSTLGLEGPPPKIPPGQCVRFDLVMPSQRIRGEDPTEAQLKKEQRAEKVELIDKFPGARLGPLTSTRHPNSRKKKPTWRN
ncbi:cold-shock protein [Lignipirellula cremea]|uniref:Cold shock protein CspC n=1 Tax=Lignipirellula cremea TaxID=2528010 RepID=A0A518DSR7_9BACT|nr:cold shock domain-containing protein [Lignipirellula cremea]QDU94883.1 Cold shock protein CspC [Lignipirellula cremea]